MKWSDVRESPLDSSVVSAVGGLIILVVGILGLRILVLGNSYTILDLAEEVFGVLCGVLIIVFSAALFLDTTRHRIYGTAIMILSASSWFGTSGGLFAGFLIGFIGGIMGFSWRPARKIVPTSGNLQSSR